LKRCVESIETQIQSSIKIIFHDVASTYNPLLEYLEKKKDNGYTVYRSEVNDHLSVMDSVETYLKEHPECEYYVITDPDIILDNVNSDILEFYKWIIQKSRNSNMVVGPIMCINDIPSYYPHRNRVINLYTSNRKRPFLITYKGEKRWVANGPLDTTFQLVSAKNLSRVFPRQGILCHAPYSAKHLDWYIDPNKMTEDQEYYSRNAREDVTNWSKIN
jgi:hypothetical protein